MTFTDHQLPLRTLALPKGNEVHCWLWQLDSLAGGLFPVADGGLSEEPLATRLKARRMTGRFFQKMLLGAYLGLPGKDVELKRNQRGRPELNSATHPNGPQFTSTHTDEWQLLALGNSFTPGVDIEPSLHKRRIMAIAKRYFHENEFLSLQAIAEADRQAKFIAMWTAKEAVVKALGCGLSGMMDQLELVEAGATGIVEDHRNNGTWAIRWFPVVEGYSGAIAVPGTEPASVVYRRLRAAGFNE